jgi:osmotically-inducible protein OsmY
MLNVLDKTDTEIKTDVLSELKYEPSLKVTDIGVLVKNGTVRTLAQREEAERIAWAAKGVFSVEDHLAVKWSSLAE